jgi:hypothetical protein
MRQALPVLVVLSLMSMGCAALVCNHGINPETLNDSQIDEIGTRTAETSQPDGERSVTFSTHHKIAEPERMKEIINRDALTFFGVAETVEFPYELYRIVRTKLFGQEVTVSYDRLGLVLGVDVGGKRAYSQPNERQLHLSGWRCNLSNEPAPDTP